MRLRPVILSLILIAFSTGAFAQDFTQVVEKSKAEVIAVGGASFSKGACGAWRITNLVAWKLQPRFKLLTKAGGNRAIPTLTGCVTQEESADPGYATDYLIDSSNGFVGYDLLGDGGGANNPQWAGPEDAADMVQRNEKHAQEPLNPRFYMTPAGTPPPPAGNPPVVTPEPVTVIVVDAALVARVDALAVWLGTLEAQAASLAALVAEAQERATATEQRVFALEARPLVTGCQASVFGVPVSCRLR